jgi:hypothetical protein
LLQGQKTHCAISNVYTLNTKRAKIIKIIPWKNLAINKMQSIDDEIKQHSV